MAASPREKARSPVCTLSLRVVPNASKDAVTGWNADGSLHVKVRAAPEDGKANKAVEALLAKTLNLTKGQVAILSGQKSRNKTVQFSGISEEAVMTLLPEQP